MTDRDRLIELLFKVTEEKDCPQPFEIADYLLANGVIVPTYAEEKLKELGLCGI